MVHTGTIGVPVLKRLVIDYPEKAIDVLMRCCHDPDIEKEIMQFLLLPPPPQKSKPHNTIDTTNISNTASTSGPITPPNSHPGSNRSGSFSGHPRTPSRSHATPRSRPDGSPTRSSTHSKSQASKSGREYITILATNDDDEMIEHVARMRSAQIEYSVIGEHMFSDGRICRSNIDEESPDQLIQVPCRRASGKLTNIPVSFRADLTWSRSSSDATHKTSFYVVPQEELGIDVLLGSRDSGEGKWDIPPLESPL
jgi:hypothetical protein